ncbi:hypothetical protein LDK18_04585 [Fusobacterium nucleatum subsp. nucleatum ATCC 23726]|uniref:Uncharacterized protein n=1 Tax=Fusobacterium nucleatum subsp. nucleatum (strain ATCC 23726 / VPI 4351) TaxID=525283 RepID=D5RDM9_FUSN2|nr:hypothetical protein [Fusobacterium nucleatum]EFG95004.1 hypothetical protein HMPREF0397_1314 [Fusobacterium nucleatum subsp. nucleatum ATCC 23726]
MEWILLYGSCLFFIFCIKIFDFDLKNFLDRYMDKILTFFVIIITFLSIFQKKFEIDVTYQTIILLIILLILVYRTPLLSFFLENFDEISIGNTKLKIKSIQSTIQNLANDGILDKNMKGIEEIRKENKENEDETLLYGKFLLNFSKIDSLLNSIETVKFRNQIVHNGIEEKYEKEELHQIFIDFINIEEKIISELKNLKPFYF